LNAPCRERVHMICGPEFGPELRGHIAVITKALYGLKTSAFVWRSHLAETLRELGYESCVADSDMWMRKATNPNGFEYYEYVLVYTDDILSISHQPIEVLNKFDQHYMLKKDSIGPSTQYLGVQGGHYFLPDDPTKPRWYLSSEKYVKEAIRNVKEWMKVKNKIPKTKVSELCDNEEVEYYQQQIGVLRWAVELGRIDITMEVLMLAAYTAAPRKGHLEALFHMYAYLSKHDRSRLVFDNSYVQIKDEMVANWKEFYPEACEDIPLNMPEPRGKEAQMIIFVDADHAGDDNLEQVFFSI
jgi:Reverse transcriptase (RNA-dependent DNA polymerase)